jgi:hypothetical protein
MSSVHLNNEDIQQEILHSQTQGISINIVDEWIFKYSDLKCFTDECGRHNDKKKNKTNSVAFSPQANYTD